MIAKKVKSKQIRARLAPSPTGNLHLGTARTALFNFLFARANKGKFILRIEDTDKERSKKEYEENIFSNLKWLGLGWDEGPTEENYKGEYSPYRQSERINIYEKYIKKLLEEDKAYYCFCSKEELNAHREYLLSIGQPPLYSNKCRDLKPKEVKENLDKGLPYIIRFKTPFKKIIFKDLIRGRVEFESRLIGDMSIAKDEKTPLYNLAAAIDDFEMKITHVIRGEDHLSNTPKQILLQEALDFPSPYYAHLPLILGTDRSKLSKRHGAVSVDEYKKQGYLPEALINMLAFLGWNPGTEREIYSFPSLIKDFSLDKCQKGGAVFNIKRLNWINGFYLRQKPIESLTDLCIPYLVEANFIEEVKNNNNSPVKSEELKLFKERRFKIKKTGEIVNFSWISNTISLYQERMKKISEITDLLDFFFMDKLDYEVNLLKWKEMSNKEIIKSLEVSLELIQKIPEDNFKKEALENKLMLEAEKMRDRGKLLWPLRVALTGKENSAGPFEIANILGKQKTINRINNAKTLLNKKT